ncbi:discoidin domain-containing protein [Lysinibacillus pakistanensis]|uniref:B30.2/SPRY domain-containing protein n=1 Tax=Lysinibacillus pakistanensis TaxID=759811 RepID=A0ABX6D7G8_9BACI|nr:hypothetical protein GDS87_07165 [Lysinibacillus pakistanensis]
MKNIIRNVAFDKNINASNTFSDDGLTVTVENAYKPAKANLPIDDGISYVEVKCVSTSKGNSVYMIGIANELINFESGNGNATDINQMSYYGTTGHLWNTSTGKQYGTSYTTGDTIGILINTIKNQVTFYKNGVSQGTLLFQMPSYKDIYLCITSGSSTESVTVTANFGASRFNYLPTNIPKETVSYEGYLIKKYLSLKNDEHYFSLENQTLILLPDNSTKNMILHGIEQGKEIQLDVPFDKHRYFNDKPVVNVSGKVFTHDIGVINTLNIKEFRENKSIVTTWYETKMTANNAPAPLVASANSEYVSSGSGEIYSAYLAFDSLNESENTLSLWATLANQHINSWIQLDFGENKNINCVMLTSRNLYIEQTPTSFYIEGSTDGQSWTTIGDFMKNDWSLSESAVFILKKGMYRYLKITNRSIKGATNGSFHASWADIKYGLREVK